jgi:hypothetical protein
MIAPTRDWFLQKALRSRVPPFPDHELFTSFCNPSRRSPTILWTSMETSRKPRKRDRFRSWIRGNKTTAESTEVNPTSTETSRESPHHIKSDDGDRQRTNERYLKAVTLLQSAVKARQEHGDFQWLDFPELIGEPEEFNDSQFREKINLAMETRKGAINDQSAWSKCKNTVECIFVALSPFAKNFLSIAQNAQSVSHTLLCFSNA